MGNTGVSDHHVHYQLIDRAANRMDPASFWNQQSYYPPEYQQYLNISDTNSSNELDNSAVAQVASGSPRSSERPFPFPPTNDLSRQSLIDRRFGKWASPPSDPGNGQPRGSVFDSSAGPIRYLSRIVPSDRQDAIGDRFGSWTATAVGTTPRNPNQFPPSPGPGRPPGIVTGQPMPLWITPPPVLGLSDRSAASHSYSSPFGGEVQDSNKPRASIFDASAPAIPFVRPNQRFSSSPGNAVGDRSASFFPADDAVNASDVSSGLAGRIAALAAAGPGSPERPTSLSRNSGLQSFNNDDELSWLIQLLSRRPR
jgi:hypothetical protein